MDDLDDPLDLIPCGFLRLAESGGGAILRTNATFLAMLGYGAGELEGRGMDAVLSDEAPSFWQTDFLPLLALRGEAEGIHLSLLDKQGEPVPVLVNAVRREIDSEAILDCICVRRTTREAEEELRLRDRAIAASDAGVFIVDPYGEDYPVVFASEGFERMTGYTAAEALGQNCRFLQGRDTDAAAVARLREAVTAHAPVRLTLLNYRKDGTTFWNEISISPVTDPTGRITHLVGIQNDVSEGRRLLSLLETSANRLAVGVKVAGLALAEIDYTTGLNHLTAEAARAFGLGETAIEVPRQSVHATFHPDDREELSRRIADSLDPAGPGWFAMDHRVVWPDGEVRWLTVRKQVFFTGDSPSRPSRAILAALDVTERKQAEALLRKSELKFRALIEGTPDAILIVDEQGRIVLVNELTTQLFGYKRTELMGQSLALLLPERFHQAHKSHFLGFVEAPRNRAMGGGLELWGRHKDGGEFPIEVSLSPLETEQETLIFSSIRDITERKRTEKTTQISEIRYRRLFEAAKDGVLLLDPETRKITDANPFMTTLLGYTHEELVGKELFEIGLLKDELASQDMFEKLTDKLQVRYENLPLESQEGKRQEVEVVANLYDENGHAVIQCNIRDITERKRAEEALHASEGRFRVLAESVPQFIWVSDTEGVLEYINPQWTEYTGLSMAQTSAQQDESVYHPDDISGMYAAWDKALQTSTPYSVEVRIRSAQDGGFRWFLTRGIPQYDTAGAVIRWFGVTTDIEDQKQAQARSADRNTLLQRAVAESHHRIKNNLQVLSALVELQVPLQGDTVPVSELKRIGQHIRTLAALHDLLTIDSKTGVDLDTVSLRAALEKLAPILQVTSGERKILIEADEMVISLKQGGSFTLLVNELVSNALKHGKSDVYVTLTLLPGNIAQLEVCDDGPGFPPGFDPLKSANTGIELIESMGRWDLRGDILYQNRPTGGACVIITFPLEEL